LLDANKDNYDDALLCEFLIFTGLRISEARKLQVNHIDMSNNMLKVVEGKGGKDRYIPITSNLLSKLRLYLGERKTGYVFAKRNETRYTVRALQYKIINCLEKSKIDKKLSTHSLRHTFGCLCLARGMDIMKIRDMMGHSDVKVTQIYAKCVLPSIKDEFLRLMDVRA
jgi:site-specific recombinase XerD